MSGELGRWFWALFHSRLSFFASFSFHSLNDTMPLSCYLAFFLWFGLEARFLSPRVA